MTICPHLWKIQPRRSRSLFPVISRDLDVQLQAVTRTCLLIVDNMSKFVEDLAAVIPIMSRFEPFVKTARRWPIPMPTFLFWTFIQTAFAALKAA